MPKLLFLLSTYSFQNVHQASAALEFMTRQSYPGHEFHVRYAHRKENRSEDVQASGRAGDTQYMGYYMNQPSSVAALRLPPRGQQGAETQSLPRNHDAGPESSHGHPESSRGPAASARAGNAAGGANSQPRVPVSQRDWVPTSRRNLPQNRDTREFSQGTQALEAQAQPPEVSNLDDQGAQTSTTLIVSASGPDAMNPHTELTTISDQKPEPISLADATSVPKIDSESEAEPHQTQAIQALERQDPASMEYQPLSSNDKDASVSVRSIPVQAPKEDPTIGSSRPRPQGGAFQGGRSRKYNKNKNKEKAKAASEAEREVPSEPQIPNTTDKKAGATAEATSTVNEGDQSQKEAAPASGEGKQPQKNAKRYKHRAHTQGGQERQTEAATSTKDADIAVPAPEPDDVDKETERPSDDRKAAEHTMTQEMTRGDSSSSHEAAPTPALDPYTQPTTYAGSEISDTNIDVLSKLQIEPEEAQQQVQQWEVDERTDLSQGEEIASVPLHPFSERPDESAEELQASQQSQQVQQPSKKVVPTVVPAVPDLSKLRQLHRNEQRLQQVQQRLENAAMAADPGASDLASHAVEESTILGKPATVGDSATIEESGQQ